MFGRSAPEESSSHLLGQHALDDDEASREMAWERTSLSERNAPTPSDLWEQDPLHNEHRPDQSQSPVSPTRPRREKPKLQPEDHGEAGTELEHEFQRLFSPVRKDQDDKARFHDDLDAACAAYSSRLFTMRETQRELEHEIELPWLLARRRRNWERFVARMSGFGTIITCFWGGTVGDLEEVPPEIVWPPPHLVRMKENHEQERQALREAHLAVVKELGVRYGMMDGGAEVEEGHVCVEKRLLDKILSEAVVEGERLQVEEER